MIQTLANVWSSSSSLDNAAVVIQVPFSVDFISTYFFLFQVLASVSSVPQQLSIAAEDDLVLLVTSLASYSGLTGPQFVTSVSNLLQAIEQNAGLGRRRSTLSTSAESQVAAAELALYQLGQSVLATNGIYCEEAPTVIISGGIEVGLPIFLACNNPSYSPGCC